MTAAADSAPWIEATYRFPPGVDAERQATIIAVGQTLGSTGARFAGRDAALQACLGVVRAVTVTATGSTATIAFPLANTEGDIGTVLTMVFGKYSLAGPARLIGLCLPAAVGSRPTHGVAGLRSRLQVPTRPLLMGIFKPALGLTADDHATLLAQVAGTDIDLIKDDEILGDVPSAPTLARWRACRPVIEAACDRRGRELLYAVNVTGRADALLARARTLVASGANALLLNVLVYGYPMLEALARDPEIGVPLIAHPAFAGALMLAPDYGLDPALVLGQLMRRAGADVVLHPTRFGSLPFDAGDEARTIHALRASDHDWPAVFPGPSAGVRPPVVPALIADYGNDLVINAGSAIFDHAGGPAAGVEAFMAVWS